MATKGNRVIDEIVRVLTRCPELTTEQLQVRLGRTNHSIVNALNRLREQGKVESVEGTRPFKWRLTEGTHNG